ncbi:hypothetical protein SCHPADRAFT_825231 [Schizopora paradoxa]|uniref:Microbial-type PARG catalytic domain-containing protein n=1 Tax=Schizopora paradoxa TaxID=27342 RepID=A0A0H2SDN3_9AGAM|nr:hypothetical protein SCHPADRAFT_825231 [Schizopora paradoxa]
MLRNAPSGSGSARKKTLTEIAQSTLKAVEQGSYVLEDVGEIKLSETVAKCVKNTRLYQPNSELSKWGNAGTVNLPQASAANGSEEDTSTKKGCETFMLHISTLEGARLIASMTSKDGEADVELERTQDRIGVLNFASAKKRGGGFLNGASAQEESIARSSTLYPSLLSDTVKPYYTLHASDPKGGYYSHNMIYSPDVLLLRDDDGKWLKPLCVDMLTSPAVNAGVVKRSAIAKADPDTEAAEKVEAAMCERAARILYAFELHDVRQIVLGAWGCGIFGNNARTVAGMWADLLGKKDSRFKGSFDRVVFAVLGQDPYEKFKEAFEARVAE